MNLENPVVLVAICLIVLVALVGFGSHFFSPEARLERRRRRNNYPVTTKARRPMVTLNTRTKK
jgi:hypothetical protein